MKYRVIYDVREDAWPWLSIVTLLLLALMAVQMYYWRSKRVPDKPPDLRIPRWTAALVGMAFLVFAWKAVDAFWEQSRCRAWAETGQYEITEGRTTDYQRYGKPSSEAFRVGDFAYHGSAGRAGYCGRFTASEEGANTLRDAVSVRVSHRHGCILRIEVAP